MHAGYILLDWVGEGYIAATSNWDFCLEISPDDKGKWNVTKKSWNIPGEISFDNQLNVLGLVDTIIS
jgi:hypothetical protein